MNNRNAILLSIIVASALVGGYAIMLHQWVVWGHLWDTDQVLHHETFTLVLVSFAAGIIVCMLILMNRKKRR